MDTAYNRLFESTNDGIFRYTFDEGRVLLANQGFVSILGLDRAPSDVAGKPLR